MAEQRATPDRVASYGRGGAGAYIEKAAASARLHMSQAQAFTAAVPRHAIAQH